MNADEILFRASCMGKIMTEPRNKSETLSERAKTYLVEKYIQEQYGRTKDFSNKYLDKGLSVEQSAITLYSRIKKEGFASNEEEKRNAYFSGTPDIIMPDKIIDIKSSFTIFTFMASKNDKLNKDYYYQVQTYCDLFDKPKGEVAYILENSPWHIVEGELRREAYKYGDNASTPNWVEIRIIANHVYDLHTFNEYLSIRGIVPSDDLSKYAIAGFVEVPLKERHHSFEFDRNDIDIARMKDRVVECRKHMNTYLFV